MQANNTLIKILKEKYKTDKQLKKIGSLESLLNYLTEEINQAALQSFEFSKQKKSKSNKNNILSYYLLEKAPLPKELHHIWNPGDYPDIDMDVSPAGRFFVRQYLENQYGKNNVMGVGTFGNGSLRSGLLDIGEAFGIKRTKINKFTTLFNKAPTNLITIADSLDWLAEEAPEIKDIFFKYPSFKTYVEQYTELIRNVGQHAAGIVISNVSILDKLPVMRGKEDANMIALNKEELQPQGFIKYDILGLNNIDILEYAAILIKERHKIDFTKESVWEKIDYETPEVYQLTRTGELDGIFQMDGFMGRKCINTIQPTCFEDLMFVNAGMRPGAIAAGAPEAYAQMKAGIKPPNYPDFTLLRQFGVSELFLKSMLKTHNVLTYQEQLMQFLHYVGDISLPDTNKVRKVITKPKEKRTAKHEKILNDTYNKYKQATLTKKIPDDFAELLWNTVIGQAGYSFNRSHCCAYAILAFRELYLKANFKYEFFAALLHATKNEKKNDKHKTNKFLDYMNSAKRFGIKVLPPNINKSKEKITLEENNIRISFSKIKYVSSKAIIDIIKNQPYSSLENYLEKTKKTTANNKRVVEGLIFSGAFDIFCNNDFTKRLDLVDTLYKIKKITPDEELEVFDLIDLEVDYLGFSFIANETFSQRKLFEKEMFGIDQVVNIPEGMAFWTFGQVESLVERKISRGKNINKPYQVLRLSNMQKSITCMMWSNDIDAFIQNTVDDRFPLVRLIEEYDIVLVCLEKQQKNFHVLNIGAVFTFEDFWSKYVQNNQA